LHKIVLKGHEDLVWRFENAAPQVDFEHFGHGSVTVDPFPCYAHDISRVRNCADLVTKAFPITWPVTFYVLSNEVTGRTNAFAQGNAFDYNVKQDIDGEPEHYIRAPYIVMSGKRIPIMPSMTRYLVAHEYGHIVEDWIAKQRKQRDSELLADYAKLRGIGFPKSYGGGTWHATPGEIFANDFRILITKQETEFWPHPCARPEDSLAVIGWWEKAKELCTTIHTAPTMSNAQQLTTL
jgi:hypothetical protein